ncbi:MAG: DNA repair protein RecO (recombination protein O) [Saprospiraceae bacterium]|jgi:DNA repair protein RecO (recombination protein O)
MLKTSEGIIVRTIKYGETSLILDIFSSDQGIRSYIVGGVRTNRGKSKVALVRVLNLVRFVAYDKGNDTLNRIKEIEYNYVYKAIPFDVVKGSLATFLIEICRKAIKASDAYEDIYNYIVKGMIHLDNIDQGLAHFHINFLIGLAEKLGFQLDNNYNLDRAYFNLSEGTFIRSITDHRFTLDKDLSLYLHAYLSKNTNPQVPKHARLELLKNLMKYYKYHISDFGELKSLPIILSLYE